jgi:hypothetical protein
VATLLRKPRVVDDPEATRSEAHLRHDPPCGPAQHLPVGPFGLGHEVMRRQMVGAA